MRMYRGMDKYKDDYWVQLMKDGNGWVETCTINRILGVKRFITHIVWLHKTSNRTSLVVVVDGNLLKRIKEIKYEK